MHYEDERDYDEEMYWTRYMADERASLAPKGMIGRARMTAANWVRALVAAHTPSYRIGQRNTARTVGGWIADRINP